MAEKEVESLYAQGRIEAVKKDGEQRYYAPSVFGQRVETLMRQKLEGMKPPEIRGLLEELSMLQYERGHTRGAELASAGLSEVTEQMQALAEQQQQTFEQLRQVREKVEKYMEEHRAEQEEHRKFLEELRAMYEGSLRRIHPDQHAEERGAGR